MPRRAYRGQKPIANVYTLTQASEGLFPERYPELLKAVLAEAEHEGLIERLSDRVAASMAAELRRKLEGLEGPAKLRALLPYYGLRRHAGHPGGNPGGVEA